MKLALDALGGDLGLSPNVLGAKQALEKLPDLSLSLIGDEPSIRTLLAETPSAILDRLEIIHEPTGISMTEKPVEALRKKPQNSISRGWQLLASKEVEGFISAGNTGAMVAAGLFTKRFLSGVRRPGIAALMPNQKGYCVIMDVGANVFPKAIDLLQYGIMGSAFARQALKIEHPKIGLINVGEEEGKGHDLVQETYSLFRHSSLSDRFIGNIEGRDIHKGVADVIVTDGFVGNVILKHAQGLFEFVMSMVGRDVLGVLQTELESAKVAYKKMISQFHYSAIGGAPLLGVDGICIICHGSSDERSITNAILAAANYCASGLNQEIVKEIASQPLVTG